MLVFVLFRGVNGVDTIDLIPELFQEVSSVV